LAEGILTANLLKRTILVVAATVEAVP
jgi:hypothetical protein